MAKFTFAPQRDWKGDVYTPEPVTLDDTPEPKAVKPEADNPFVFAPGLARKAASFDPFGSSESSGLTTAAFKFAPGLLRKATSSADESGLGGIVKSHDDHDDDDCSCDGACSDCATKTAKNTFRPGQKIRHKKTGRLYEMVKTYCVSANDCYCVLKRDGAEHDCLFYTDEVEAVA
jgi:hypothetical protein